jgi:hypothetical protein
MKLKPYKDDFKSVFLIIKTTEGDVFGAYTDQVIYRNDTSYFDNEKTFVFKVNEPKMRCVSSGLNRKYFYAGKDFIAFGAADGESGSAAIYLNSSL